MNLETLYKTFSTNQDCNELLLQSHWFASFANFDPKTGETLPMSLNKVLTRISQRQPSHCLKDRLWLLAAHSEEAARRLMKALSEEPRRDPAYLPIRQVRELDTASFIALSRRPGRNIREKLADKPYMQAVRHYQSIDVPENRLLKTYLMQLADALELRKKYLKDGEVEDFLQTIYRWLNEDEIKDISPWENLAPNNALLSHRDYRRVWNSWRWLQSLEDDIERDFSRLEARRKTKTKWEELAKRYANKNAIFADMPVFVDFDNFQITPWDSSLPALKVSGALRNKDFFETQEPVCLDLTQLQPLFATPSCRGALNDYFFWQRWSNGDDSVDLELFDSDAVFAHREDALTITCSDLFFYKFKKDDATAREKREALTQAARAFSLRLQKHFHNGNLIWLTPDSLNDFELEITRRNINACFSQAEPLPCSVAAVFEHIDYKKIDKDGYKVAVVERINGKAYLTEMVARYDEDLAQALPETRGYIWEKSISELASTDVEADKVETSLYLLGKDGSWTREINPYGVAHDTDQDRLMSRDGYDCAILLNGRPVEGGIKFFQLQRQVKDIPLWRNHIPELMTKVMMDGFYQPFYFVGKDVTVQPVRGKAVRIKVPEEFTLPAGKKTYRLPLLQGKNEETLEYEAKLVSKDFPYAEDVKCRLNMTYTYGVDDPYKLVFEPLDKKYRCINVVWQLKEDVVIDDAPAPGYPVSAGWSDVVRNYYPQKDEYRDLTEWCLSSAQRLLEILEPLSREPLTGRVACAWQKNNKGVSFAFIENPNGEDYYFNTNFLAHGVNAGEIHKGDVVYFYVETSKDYVWTKSVSMRRKVTMDDYSRGVSERASKYICKAMYVPFIRVWADGRSCGDADCPASFRDNILPCATKLIPLLSSPQLSSWLKRNITFILCCMGKDMPASAVSIIPKQAKEKSLDERAMGFALGDLSMQWQREIFSLALQQNDGLSLRAFAQAIWRSERFVEAFSYDDLVRILDCLYEKIRKNTVRLLKGKDEASRKESVAHLTRYLELLLGLLRTRDSQDENVRMLLQPGQHYTAQFSKLIHELIADAVKNGEKYFSRLQLDVSMRAADDLTPDLLYALKVYLEGDMASSAIRVTGVVDEDELV